MRRGFTLLEMMIAVAVVSVVGALAVTNFVRWQRFSTVREVAVGLTGDLREARSLAMSGRTNFTGFVAGDRVECAGVRRIDDDTYEVFVDRDEVADGNEVVIRRVDAEIHGFPIILGWPVPEVRFDRSGLLTTGVEQRFTSRDTGTGREVQVLVALGGKAELVR